SPTVSKSTAAVPATPANAAGATQSTPSAPIASRAVQEIEPQTPSPAARTAQPAAEGTAESMEPEGDLTINPEDTFLTGDKYEIAISNLMEMGYSREMCVKAMRAGFNNPNQAAEYLLTGIPEGADMPHSSEGAGDEGIQQQQQQQQQASPGDGLEILRGSEEFQNLRRMVQSNPQLLQDVLQQLEQSNPEVARRINENREEFLQMLLEGAEIEGEGDDAMQPQFIRITQEEKEAIDRLTELGFERDLVIQAYFACDKNEEMTANYLFNHGHED
ncbi:UV excision repair protein rad23, partial [Spiromyces aspiralis]